MDSLGNCVRDGDALGDSVGRNVCDIDAVYSLVKDRVPESISVLLQLEEWDVVGRRVLDFPAVAVPLSVADGVGSMVSEAVTFVLESVALRVGTIVLDAVGKTVGDVVSLGCALDIDHDELRVTDVVAVLQSGP